MTTSKSVVKTTSKEKTKQNKTKAETKTEEQNKADDDYLSYIASLS